jgi:hypothetical protein
MLVGGGGGVKRTSPCGQRPKKHFFENAQDFIKHRLGGVRGKLKTDNRLLFRNKFLFLINFYTSSIVVASFNQSINTYD